MNLKKEINLNLKVIIIVLFMCIVSLGLYTSYAYFQISVIQDNIIVISTKNIIVNTEVVNNTNQTFTLASGETKTIAVNLTTDETNNIGYKMYYDITDGISNFIVTSTETFTNDIVEGTMNTSKTINLTFENTGSNDITIKLGTQGGIEGYSIDLDEGLELKLNETLYVSLKSTILNAIENPSSTSCKTNVVEDGITYISGSSDCIDFNYVWYSGKLWRITSINEDGSMKLITDDAITTISYNGSDAAFYTDESTNSYMYQWLNQDFLSTLYNYENIIETNALWYSLTTTSSSTKINSTVYGTVYTAPVALLNSYEYYMSYKNTSNSSGYLNIGYWWYLLNPYYSTTNVVYRVNNEGNTEVSSYNVGTRPSIILKSSVALIGGDGTKTNPYRIVGDKEEAEINTTLLNTRTSGEYVKFNEELYRIVSIEEDGTIKLNKNDYIRDTSNSVVKKVFASTTTFGLTTNTQSDNYWDYYLNNTWYNSISSEYQSMMTTGTYYLGQTKVNYKLSICASVSSTLSTKDCEKTTSIWTGYVGLPRYGEMFASEQGSGYSSSFGTYFITSYSSSEMLYVSSYGLGNNWSPSIKLGARPSINLKSTVKITGGTGLKDDPYEISL